MNLRPEILLVYAEEDNQPIDPGMNGWVSSFYKFFTTLMSQISKYDLSIRMVSEETFIQSEVPESAAVLAVLTPNLVKQDMIVNTLSGWVQMTSEDELKINGVHRIFKILKKPFDSDNELPELADYISYDFFHVDSLTGEAIEFRRFFGVEAERSFWMKLVDLAYDVNAIIRGIFEHQESNKGKEISREKTVYLASTGIDLVTHRDVIKRELKRHGYEVLPKHTFPKEPEILEKLIKDDLAKSRLSIHMVGEDYGQKPLNSEISIVDLENKLASEHSAILQKYNESSVEKKLFSRLIWVSPDLKNISERQKIFIEDLKSEASSHEESEVLQIPLQELKAIIREELVTGGRFRVHEQEADDEETEDCKSIYLIHDKNDTDNTKKLESYLLKKGYKVLAPSYEGDLVDIRNIHQENLRKCDGSIIYYGNASEEWIITKLQDLLKAPGFGRKKPMLAKAVYLEGKKEVDERHFKKYKTLLLKDHEGFKPEGLQPFLTKLEHS